MLNGLVQAWGGITASLTVISLSLLLAAFAHHLHSLYTVINSRFAFRWNSSPSYKQTDKRLESLFWSGIVATCAFSRGINLHHNKWESPGAPPYRCITLPLRCIRCCQIEDDPLYHCTLRRLFMKYNNLLLLDSCFLKIFKEIYLKLFLKVGLMSELS